MVTSGTVQWVANSLAAKSIGPVTESSLVGFTEPTRWKICWLKCWMCLLDYFMHVRLCTSSQPVPSSEHAVCYLCYIVPARAGVVAEPAEEGLVDATTRSPGFTVERQILPAVPQDGVGERHWSSCKRTWNRGRILSLLASFTPKPRLHLRWHGSLVLSIFSPYCRCHTTVPWPRQLSCPHIKLLQSRAPFNMQK